LLSFQEKAGFISYTWREATLFMCWKITMYPEIYGVTVTIYTVVIKPTISIKRE